MPVMFTGYPGEDKVSDYTVGTWEPDYFLFGPSQRIRTCSNGRLFPLAKSIWGYFTINMGDDE